MTLFVQRLVVVSLCVFGIASCSNNPVEEPVEIRLVDVTDQSGLDFVTTCGSSPSTQILEVNGGGVAFIDYDNDGDPDLFVANGATLDSPHEGPGSKLFRNDSQSGRIRYTDVTKTSGIHLNRWAMGASTGDIDGDGWADLHITCWGPNALFRNRGDGTFEDITTSAGLFGDAWSTTSCFGDVDADGDLDLYVVNYLEFDPLNPPRPARFKEQDVLAGPRGLPPQADRLWINEGDGTFTDAAEKRVLTMPSPAYGLNAIILDFDGDGRQDIIVGNDSMANHLFVNAPKESDELSLHDVGQASGIATNMDGSEQATMGMAVVDLDANGEPDLFTTNFSADTNTLHRNVEQGVWQDRTRQYGLGMPSRPWLGWTTAFVDLTGDGLEDLIILNGHVYPNASLETMDSEYEQPPQVLIRSGDRFIAIDPTDDDNWLGIPRRDRAGVLGDIDGDGDFDLVTAELNGPVRIIQNQTQLPRRVRPVVVHLQDDRPNVQNGSGIGSRIRLLSDVPSTRWIHSGGAFQSAHDSAACFHVSRAAESMVFEITWPDGTVTLHDVSPAARMTIRHSQGKPGEHS